MVRVAGRSRTRDLWFWRPASAMPPVSLPFRLLPLSACRPAFLMEAPSGSCRGFPPSPLPDYCQSGARDDESSRHHFPGNAKGWVGAGICPTPPSSSARRRAIRQRSCGRAPRKSWWSAEESDRPSPEAPSWPGREKSPYLRDTLRLRGRGFAPLHCPSSIGWLNGPLQGFRTCGLLDR